MARSSTSNRGRQEKAAPEAISADYASVSNRCYTTAGGAVTVAIERRGAFMEISVIDTGRGIAAADLPHVFERYWRATDADDGAAGISSGLGLTIVKRILDLHGSVVRVHSEFERGTRFDFLLPQAG